MSKKDWICFFKGHCDDEENENIPYGFCPRCEKDYNDWIKTLKNRWYLLRYNITWWFRKHLYWKCSECKKTKIIFGKNVNNHDECLPF